MYTSFLYGVGRNDFDAGKIHALQGPLEGVGLKIKTFLGHEMATSAICFQLLLIISVQTFLNSKPTHPAESDIHFQKGSQNCGLLPYFKGCPQLIDSHIMSLYVQCMPIICCCMRNLPLHSKLYLAFFVILCAYANNLLPYA
jgi:hypothetical protein